MTAVPPEEPALVLARDLGERLDRSGLPGIAEQRGLLDRLGPEHLAPAAPDPAALPVLAHLPSALALARAALPSDVADALHVAATGAPWTQTAAYVADPPDDRFLDGYAHATLLGPPDGPPAQPGQPGEQEQPDAAALGLLLLAPGVVYPHHAHPADEVYLPLTPARWSHALDRAPTAEPVGVLLHHRPHQPHAMATDDTPLLALYLWTGEVTRASAWC